MSVLQRLRSLPIARAIHREPPQELRQAYRADTLTLGWEERLKGRGRRVSDTGLEFGTALPRGSILRGGDCLVLEEVQTIVTIVELAEPVLVIEPSSAYECGLFAYHIGNSHQPLMLAGNAILCPDLPGVRQVLDYHRIRFSPARRPFTPVGFVPNHQH
jgi:urease accessory protein